MRTNSEMAASSFPCRINFSALRSVTARSMGTALSQRSRSALVNVNVGREPADALRQPFVHRIKQRRRPERSAVHVRVAEARDRVEVIGGRIALVPIEAVARVAAV